MGSYHSQTAANLVLLFHELDILQDETLRQHIRLLNRYIDDGFMIINCDPMDLTTILTRLLGKYPQDIPTETSSNPFQTDFLDLTISINHDSITTNRLSYRTFQKPYNAYTYTHYTTTYVLESQIDLEIWGDCELLNLKSGRRAIVMIDHLIIAAREEALCCPLAARKDADKII